MAEHEVQKTIDFYEKLVTLYPTCESWANNIQESIKLLTTDLAHTNFYSYLFNPSTYTFQSNIKCCTHEDEVKYNKMVEDFENKSTQTTKLYKNGLDGKIFYHNKKKKQNGKKQVDHIFGSVPQNPQNALDEASNETRSGGLSQTEEKIDT